MSSIFSGIIYVREAELRRKLPHILHTIIAHELENPFLNDKAMFLDCQLPKRDVELFSDATICF